MEQKPQWLKEINQIVKESDLKIQELEEAIKNINYDKGMQLALNPPGMVIRVSLFVVIRWSIFTGSR
ncbi:MAG: hypothetical protein IPJ79_06905 [Bacteroidetes bacterium]|nr:hypothetical protein [Bacteroidota bacterium]